jgi:hypothetical protein
LDPFPAASDFLETQEVRGGGCFLEGGGEIVLEEGAILNSPGPEKRVRWKLLFRCSLVENRAGRSLSSIGRKSLVVFAVPSVGTGVYPALYKYPAGAAL